LLTDIRAKIDGESQALYKDVASSLGELHRAQRLANQAARAARAARAAPPSPPRRRRGWHSQAGAADPPVAESTAEAAYLNSCMQAVAACANYYRTRLLFDQLRRRLVVSAAI